MFWKARFDAACSLVLALGALAAYIQSNFDNFTLAFVAFIAIKVAAWFLNLVMVVFGFPLFYHHRVLLPE